ncbi:MAG: hypothetical protein AB1861_24875 [Cyanobacteriota bacterium]
MPLQLGILNTPVFLQVCFSVGVAILLWVNMRSLPNFFAIFLANTKSDRSLRYHV